LISPRFTDSIFVDTSSRENIQSALGGFAIARKIGETYTDMLIWLAKGQGRWLVFFDNADDPDVRLHEFFPQSPAIDILVTTPLVNPQELITGHERV
jgi:hypothetical protein